MDKPSLFVLVRHGESERNVAKKNNAYFPDNEARKRVHGIPDHKIDLTERGVSQAKETGAALRERFGAFDYVYHSGYVRTLRTAEEILLAYPDEDRMRIKVRQNLLIRERDPGYAYDMTTEEAEEAFPWLSEYWQTFGDFFAYPPGGESLAKTTERVNTFLHSVFRERAGQKVMVVGHEWILKALRFLLEHWDYEEAVRRFKEDPIQNCAVSVYAWDDAARTLVCREANTVYWKQ